VTVSGRRDNRVMTRLRIAVADVDLLLLQPIDSHGELALIALHGGHGSSHVVDHRAQIHDLLLHDLGLGMWCGHGDKGGKGGIGCASTVAVCATPATMVGGFGTKLIWLGLIERPGSKFLPRARSLLLPQLLSVPCLRLFLLSFL
jgi:hypothetical protein